MKFLHIADLHLGIQVHEFSMLEEQRHILGQIQDLAKAHKVDAVLIAGDVYDRGIPGVEAVKLLDGFLSGLPCPVCMITIPEIACNLGLPLCENKGFSSKGRR